MEKPFFGTNGRLVPASFPPPKAAFPVYQNGCLSNGRSCGHDSRLAGLLHKKTHSCIKAVVWRKMESVPEKSTPVPGFRILL